MRTTLDIDDDLLATVNEIARRERRTAGQVVCRLLRHSLTDAAELGVAASRGRGSGVAGFVPFFARPGLLVTNEQVNRLRDAEGA